MGHQCGWLIHVICRRNWSYRVILKSPEGDKLKYAAHLQYQTTNNEAEYEALLKGLKLVKSLKVELVIVQRDS